MRNVHDGTDESDPNVRKQVQKKMYQLQKHSQRPTQGTTSSSSLPPGQTKAPSWLVMDSRPSRFHFSLDDTWRLEVVHGGTTSYITLSDIQSSKDVETLDAMPFHCVTSWSYSCVRLQGIRLSSLLAPIVSLDDTKSTWKSMVQYGADKYSTSLPRDAVMSNDAFLVFRAKDSATGGWKPLDHEHGSVRLLFPRLYGYKSAKWLVRLEFCEDAVQGFWEAKGYHDVGEVALGQRYSDTLAGSIMATIMNPLNGWFSWYAINFPANFLTAQQCLSLDIRQTLVKWRFYWLVVTFWICFPFNCLYHGCKVLLRLVLKGQAIKYHTE